MGEVWLAQKAGAAPVVLKRVLPHLARSPEFHARFLHEARVLARLAHPNVVRVLELGQVGDEWFLAMEHVAGVDVKRLLERGALPIAAAVRVAVDAAAALEAAHTARDSAGRLTPVVHRDVSPHNLLVDAAGRVVLIDFGVASLAGQGAGGEKLAYAAPEQLLEGEADPRSDQYSLGVVLWECLVGRPAFDAEDDVEVMRLVTEVGVPPLPAAVPAALAEVVARMTALEPGARFEDVAAAREALRSVARALRFDPGARAVAQLAVSAMGTPGRAGDSRVHPELRLSPAAPLDDVERYAVGLLAGMGARFDAEEAERRLEAALPPGAPPALDVLQALLEKGALVAVDEGGERRFELQVPRAGSDG
jgi:serine/threonine protein kinase